MMNINFNGGSVQNGAGFNDAFGKFCDEALKERVENTFAVVLRQALTVQERAQVAIGFKGSRTTGLFVVVTAPIWIMRKMKAAFASEARRLGIKGLNVEFADTSGSHSPLPVHPRRVHPRPARPRVGRPRAVLR